MIEWVPKQKKEDGKGWFAVVDERNTTEDWTEWMGGDGRDLGRRHDLVTQ